MAAFVLVWLIPYLLGRLSLAADRLRRAAGDLHRLAQQAGGQQPPGADAGAPSLLVRHAIGQGRGEDRGGEARSARGRPAGEALRRRAAPTSAPTMPGCCWPGSRPGCCTAREILAEGLAGRATAIMLDYTQQGVAVRTMVDGVWIPREPRGREVGDPALESLKLLCGLNPQGPPEPAGGDLRRRVRVGPLHRHLRLAGNARRRAGADPVRGEEDPLQDARRVGHEDQAARATPGAARHCHRASSCFRPCPAAGCAARWTWCCTPATASPASSPPWRRRTNRYQAVENIPVTTYKAADGQSPADVLPKFFRTEPNVVVVRDLVDAETVEHVVRARSPTTG